MVPNQLIQDSTKQPILKTKEEALRRDTILKERELEEGLTRLGFEGGLRVFGKLRDEYSNLGTILVSRGIDDALINSKRLSTLTSSLYRQGLGLLVKVLNTYQQQEVTDTDSLITENEELKGELSKYSTDSRMYSLVSERISRNANSIKTVKSFKDKLDELFMEVRLCIDSIREIRLGLPELMSSKPRDELDKALLELRTRMEFAQRVQAEYASQGV